jgi:hypothetical protein
VESYDEQKRVSDINTIISISSQVLNFESTHPTKLLGSTLQIANLTDSEHIVELQIDTQTFNYSRQHLKSYYEDPQLPFNLIQAKDATTSNRDNICNSEVKSGSWFIENPMSKDLTKRITLKLGAKAEQDFVIVLKAPNYHHSQNIVSQMQLSLLTFKDEEFGVK